MTDNNAARIARIREKVVERGWRWKPFEDAVGWLVVAANMCEIHENSTTKWCATAERLLSALAPGPVVEIEHHEDGECQCAFRQNDESEINDCYCALGFGGESGPLLLKPGHGCPKLAPPGYQWRLCLLPKEVPNE